MYFFITQADFKAHENSQMCVRMIKSSCHSFLPALQNIKPMALHVFSHFFVVTCVKIGGRTEHVVFDDGSITSQCWNV